jgi:hypothetical protein
MTSRSKTYNTACRHRSQLVVQASVSSVRAMCVLSVLLLHRHTCSSQETPMVGTTKFDNNASYRTNVCGIHQQLIGDQIELRDALRGLNMSVYMTTYRTAGSILFKLTQEGNIPEKDPGIMPVLLDELGRRAGFKWRNSFATGNGISKAEDGNKTYTDLLIWSTDSYDISADYWNESNERKAKGISYPFPWYDDSIILISKTKKKREFGSFLKPFHWRVWVAIGISIFGTGCLYNFLEQLNHNSDERRPDALTSAFLSATTFTGHFEFRVSSSKFLVPVCHLQLLFCVTLFLNVRLSKNNLFKQPNSHGARLLSFSWSLWSLIIASAYTANMASFLLTRDTPSIAVSNLEDVVRLEKSVCLWGKTNHDAFFTKKYSEYSKKTQKVIRNFNNENEVLNGLLNNECDVALIGKQSYEALQRNDVLNANCSLVWVGRALEIIPAGFATTIDTGTYCTSLISYVLDLHLDEMEEDGFLDKAWEEAYDNVGSKQCDNSGTSSEKEPEPLGMQDMFGIFELHAICSVLSLLLAFSLAWWKRHMTHSKARRSDIGAANQNVQESESIWAIRPANQSVQESESIWGPRQSTTTSSLRQRRPRRNSRLCTSMPLAMVGNNSGQEGRLASSVARRQSITASDSKNKAVRWGTIEDTF